MNSTINKANLKKVKINGFNYFADETKRLLYLNENGDGEVSFNFCTGNELKQIYNHLHYSNN